MKKTRFGLIALVLATAMLGAMSAKAEEGATAAAVVNINTATAAELSYLPGIGPSKAAAIIKQRETREFKKVEELMRVRGIGKQTFKKLQPYLAVQGATTLKAKIANRK